MRIYCGYQKRLYLCIRNNDRFACHHDEKEIINEKKYYDMKKALFISVMMVMMTAVSAMAQKVDYDGKHEVAVSYGWVSNSDWIDVFEGVGAAMVGVTLDGESYTGPIAIEYHYRVSPLVAVGGIGVYGSSKQDIYLMGKDHGKDGKMTNNYFTVMPSVKFDWLRTRNFGMYSKLAAGVTFRSEKMKYDKPGATNHSDNDVHFNWQASLIGAEVGGENIRAFAELGLGEQGMALVGVRARF